MTRIAILAAMAGELAPLVKGWQRQRQNGIDLWTRSSGERQWTAAFGGAGQQAATRAFAAVEQTGRVDAVLSVGWVGALAEQFVPGRAYRIDGVIDQQTGERFVPDLLTGLPQGPKPGMSSQAGDVCPESRALQPASDEDISATRDAGAVDSRNGKIWLVTSSRVADEQAKQRLASTYAAQLVDMEAAAVARLARMRNIPFYAVKGVSDGFHDRLPDFNRFLDASGRFHTGRLVAHVLPRPWHWPALVRMGRQSSQAARAMSTAILDLLTGL